MTGIQMCTVGDLPGQGECHRVAQWEWKPDDADHPLFLCNAHADPLLDARALRTRDQGDTG